MRGILSFLAVLLLLQSSMAHSAPRTVHVVVVLADNSYQGIVPVAKALGDGQNPKTNLYWGAAYGVKTFFSRDPSWRMLDAQTGKGDLLERVIFKNLKNNIIMVADAYDGRTMARTLEHFMRFAEGAECETISLAEGNANTGGANTGGANIGGCADLLVFVGHNGLMDAPLQTMPHAEKDAKPNRKVAVFACMSQQYFSAPLKQAGIEPAILTTQLMAPEAYNVSALVEGWSAGKSKTEIRDAVAINYSRYQKLSAPARRLFATNYLQ